MGAIYDFSVFLYHLAVRILSPFNLKARRYRQGRKNWYQKLRLLVEGRKRFIWFHCSSLGEFEQGRPLMEAIKRDFPQYQIILTFFSPSGYEVRKNYPLADVVFYLPPDTRKNAKMFIQTVRPEKAFFIKYEFWHHYISGLKEAGIPLYLVSGIFRKEQPFFSRMPWGAWFRRMLGSFTHFFVQDRKSANLLAGIGITGCTVTGDTRFDRVAAIAKSAQPFPIVEKFSAGVPVLVAGSTWKPDEEILVPFIEGHDDIRYIIVPHEVNPGNMNRIIQMLKKPALLFSQATEENIAGVDILIVDSVGILSSLYRYGTFAYIGGGFGAGIHNILEAATFGLPVLFGPNYKKFREACQLVEEGAAFPVHSSGSLQQALLRLINDRDLLKRASATAAEYVRMNQGAAATILDFVFSADYNQPGTVGKL
jgi:3-deoxy-D-manno-octulosonic-acid transferase